MTPKEKAIELWLSYYELIDDCYSSKAAKGIAKQFTLIAVDLRLDGHFLFTSIEYGEDSLEYWRKVKQELENF
jgi:hypothetical protein